MAGRGAAAPMGALGAGIAWIATALIAAGYAAPFDPWLEVAANFRLHGALLAALAALVALAGRRPRIAALAAVATGAALAGLGPVWDSPRRPGPGEPVTLVYANLSDRNPAPAEAARALLATGADVIVTSETTPGAAAELAAHRPHRLVRSGGVAMLRTAIWSRFPLEAGQLYLNNTIAPTGAAARLVLPGGGRLGIVGVHLSRPLEGLHMRQAAALGPITARLAAPTVVVGDFNAAPWTPVVARAAAASGTRIAGGFRITWRGAYSTPFGPLPEPLGHQIDQVLVAPEISIERVATMPVPGSDHRGLVVRLRVP